MSTSVEQEVTNQVVNSAGGGEHDVRSWNVIRSL
jgi:hypothetical protein